MHKRNSKNTLPKEAIFTVEFQKKKKCITKMYKKPPPPPAKEQE